MPNWVRNKMNINGDASEIARFLSDVRTNDSLFSFRNIVPRPKELDMTSGGYDEEYIQYYLSTVNNMPYTGRVDVETLEENASSYWYEAEQNVTALQVGERYVKNQEEYGAHSWYDWCWDNWGTKWDACDPYVEYKDGSDSALVVFDTAWNAPNEIYLAIASQYPELNVHVEYADEDIGSNCGIIDNGDECDLDVDPYRFACDVWGYDYEEYMADMEEV